MNKTSISTSSKRIHISPHHLRSLSTQKIRPNSYPNRVILSTKRNIQTSTKHNPRFNHLSSQSRNFASKEEAVPITNNTALFEWNPEKQSHSERLKRLIIKPAEQDVIGIKMGSYNTNLAFIEEGSPIAIRTRDEKTSQIPTAVSIAVDGVILLGKQAMERQLLNPSGVVYDFMRYVGTKELTSETVEKDQKLIPYKLIAHEDLVAVELWDKKYSIEDLLQYLLKKVQWITERQLVRKVEQCVLTVPPSWSEEQREQYRIIVSKAGWKVNDVINEPIAIAYAYGKKRSKGHKTAIYDLGGASFTFSLLEAVEDDTLQIKTTKATRYIGGIDFDNILLDYLVFQCANDLGIDFRTNELAMHRLKEAAKKAKEDLSTRSAVEIDIPFIYADQLGPKHFKTTITSDAYNEIAFPYLWRTFRFINQAFEEAEWNIQDVDQVILAGGMSKWPLIKQLLSRYFGGTKTIFDFINPDEVSAFGAAQYGEIQRKMHIGNPPSMNPLSLGFSVSGGAMVHLLKRGVFFPIKKSAVVTTSENDQTDFQLDIYQGERLVSSRNRYIGSLVVENIDPLPAGTVQLQVDFELDKTGVLKVGVQDMYTKQGVSDTFGSVLTHGLSKQEIQNEVILGESWREADQHAVGLLELHEKAQNVYEQLLDDAKRVAGTVPPNIVKPFYESMDRLRKCIEFTDGLTEKDYKAAIAAAQRHYVQFEEFWFQSQANPAAVDLRNRWEAQHAAYNPIMNIRQVDLTKTKLERIPPPRMRINETESLATKRTNDLPDFSWWERVYQMPQFMGFHPEQQKFMKQLVEEGRYRATGKGGIRTHEEALEQLDKTAQLEYNGKGRIVKRGNVRDILGEYFSTDYIQFNRYQIKSPQLLWLHAPRPPPEGENWRVDGEEPDQTAALASFSARPSAPPRKSVPSNDTQDQKAPITPFDQPSQFASPPTGEPAGVAGDPRIKEIEQATERHSRAARAATEQQMEMRFRRSQRRRFRAGDLPEAEAEKVGKEVRRSELIKQYYKQKKDKRRQ